MSLDIGKMEAKAPSKELMAAYQPWVDIAKGNGSRWFCGFGSIDEYLLKIRADDACALNDHGSCIVSWSNRYDGTGFNYPLTRPVAETIAYFVKIQRELKLPEVMIVSEGDCSEALSREYLQAYGKRSGDEIRMDSPYWVECAVEGRARSWRGVSDAVEAKEVPCGKGDIYKNLVCESYTVTVDGRKKVFPGVRPPFATARDFSQDGYSKLMQELAQCDSRIADYDEVYYAAKSRRQWTRKHLEMLREHCAVAAVAFANPDVTAWAKSVLAKYDTAIARTPASARIDQR